MRTTQKSLGITSTEASFYCAVLIDAKPSLYFFIFGYRNLFNKCDQDRNERKKITEDRGYGKGKQSIYKPQRYGNKIIYAQAFNIRLPKTHNGNTRAYNGKYAFYSCKGWQCTEQCKYTKKYGDQNMPCPFFPFISKNYTAQEVD